LHEEFAEELVFAAVQRAHALPVVQEDGDQLNLVRDDAVEGL
jgi:hypothetical protein